MQRTDRDPDTLNRPEGNDLESNYEVHDIGQAHVKTHCEHMGFVVEEWGIDKRHESDSLIYDDKMDLKIHEHDQGDLPASGVDIERANLNLVAFLEVKTKRNEDWFGVINRRHLRKYLTQAHKSDVPAVIYMSLVDDTDENEGQASIVRDTFIPIQRWDELTKVMDGEYDYYPPEAADQFLIEQVDDYPLVESTWRAPDGNQVVTLDVDQGLDWTEFTNLIYE